MKNNIFSVIDLGTNNIQLLVTEGRKNPKIIVKDSQISALGKNFKNGLIDTEKLEKAKLILEKFIDLSQKYTNKIVVIGTSLSRTAKNISVISDWLEERDIPFYIISGDEEAYLNGLANTDDFKEFTNILFFDIGGGSTEFTLVQNGKIIKKFSLKLGIRRLENMFCNYLQKEEYTQKILKKIDLPNKNFTLIGIGGTVTSLSFINQNLVEYNFEKIHKSALQKAEVKEILDKFLTVHIADLKNSLILKMLKPDILATGTMIVYEILDYFARDKFLVSDKGLMFGVLKDKKYFSG